MHIDPNNREFLYGLKLVEETNQNVFLTGKAGTGKTTFLKYFRETTRKKYAVVAPTGIAAINAGGVTIHSFFQIPLSVFVPDDPRLRRSAPRGDADQRTIFSEFKYNSEKKELLANLDVIIIDEVSMVRCDILDVIDSLLRNFGGGNHNLPFGGKQMVLIGDAFQLPPVVKGEEKEIIGRFYNSPFFFSSRSFGAVDSAFIELKKIYRQQNDLQFIDILNRIRIGQPVYQDFAVLNAKVDPVFDFNANKYIYLGTHKAQVSGINEEKLNALSTPLYEFRGTITGKFPSNDLPTNLNLQLKEGAQVMFVKNHSSGSYYNGLVGKVKTIEENTLIVQTKEGREIVADRVTWEKIRYEWDPKEKKVREVIEGAFTQYPLKLAWAITVHKSQGLTFEEVYADVKDAFAEGQVYVALSRCTSLNGLKLKRAIPPTAIKVSSVVLAFYNLLSKRPVKVPKDPEITAFEVSSTRVEKRAHITIRWKAEHGQKVRLEPVGEVSGNELTFQPRKDMVFQLVVLNELGISVWSKPIAVKVSKEPPVIEYFESSHDYVFSGTPFELHWSVNNAHSVAINPVWEGPQLPEQGQKTLSISNPTDFELIATSFYGVVTRKAISVHVLSSPIIEYVKVPTVAVESQIRVELATPQLVALRQDAYQLPKDSQLPSIQSVDLDRSQLEARKFYLEPSEIRLNGNVMNRFILSFQKHISALMKMVSSKNGEGYE